MSEDDSQQEQLIAVFGATGTGKSTFINLASGSNFEVGQGLCSCTSEVAYSPSFELSGRRVVLIDNPGFDDTLRNDRDILNTIASNLSVSYANGGKLSGVIYVHRINDFRIGGVSRRNFDIFQKLCGDQTFKNVSIVTTMWGLVDPVIGEERERELMSNDLLFKSVVDGGAQMVRHDDTRESALEILKRILDNHPEPLKIQRELVDERKGIEETAAGKQLTKEMEELIERHQEELEEVHSKMEETLKAQSEETRKKFEELREDLLRRVKEVKEDRDRLATAFVEERRQAQAKLERSKAEAKARKAEANAREAEANLQKAKIEAELNLERVKAEAELNLQRAKAEAEARAHEAEVRAREAEISLQKVKIEVEARAQEAKVREAEARAREAEAKAREATANVNAYRSEAVAREGLKKMFMFAVQIAFEAGLRSFRGRP